MKYNVLYINHTSEVGGAVLSLYNLILSISDYVNPIVLLPGYGGAYNFFSSKGIKCLVCKLPILGHPFLDGRQQAPV